MTLWTGPFLPLAALIWPLLLGLSMALPRLRPYALRLLLLAPLPALVLALTGQEATTGAPEVLLGVTLALTEAGRLLLGMTAGLWLAAGLFAQSMAGGRNLALFAGFWCLTLAGNLGVFLAADVITFYVAFAAVSLAAWVLVVHERTAEALRAGRLYILLAVVGEVCLLMGFLIGVQAAESFVIADIRAALAEAPLRAVAVALMVAGFGIKAGMVPLHIWLPLAHPAAPVAASAVLSGAIVKAGLAGFWLFLPPGAFAEGLVVLGLAGAFTAALWGVTQINPKAVLAYSTVSQMGLMLALIGGGVAPLSVAFYALHHGLAKGALFLSVGAVKGAVGRARWLMLAMAGLAALSVAGLPLTGGSAVKVAEKSDLSGALALGVTATGVTTGLVMAWFLLRLARSGAGPSHRLVWQRLPVIALALAALALPWMLWPPGINVAPGYALSGAALRDGFWPLAVAAALVLPAKLFRFAPPVHRPGGMLAKLPVRGRPFGGISSIDTGLAATSALRVAGRVGWLAESVERALIRWRWSGLGAVMAFLALTLMMQ